MAELCRFYGIPPSTLRRERWDDVADLHAYMVAVARAEGG